MNARELGVKDRRVLTDEQLRELARERVREHEGDSWVADVTIVSDPPGAWVQPRHIHGRQYLGGPWPFFIDRADGLVTMLGFRDGVRATKAITQWHNEGKPEVNAIFMGTAVDSPLFETWVRLWLVGANERYSRLSVPAPGAEARQPSKPWWTFW